MVPRTDQSQILQRLRVGATGLVLVVLLIVLASALFRSAIDEAPIGDDTALLNEAANAAVVNATPTANPDEPLAELGVSPGVVPTNTATPCSLYRSMIWWALLIVASALCQLIYQLSGKQAEEVITHACRMRKQRQPRSTPGLG